MMPAFLRSPDPDFRGLDGRVLIAQRQRWQAQRGEAYGHDRWWAGVCELRDDGAAYIVPLTLARIETYAALYAVRQASESFSIEPGGTL